MGLGDVYCIGTGAMFSSGFFLLPGLAAAQAGPAAILAYLVAGLLMVPSMLSMAELSTALPRAGGSYFFVDRSLGPAAGTITGIGTWLALMFKSAFALVGMGAYLAITPGLATHLSAGALGTSWMIKALAVGLTVVFVVVNVIGARQSTLVQKILVVALLAALGLFLTEGLWHMGACMPPEALRERYTPFLHPQHGWSGLVGTVGLVFVSYAGLTKVASISEEVRRPERNLPLGMVLALMTATVVYALGMLVIVAVLAPDRLHGDLTPVATAATAFRVWLPDTAGTLLVVIAAVAAFASTGNAGILAASRYPLAMARDGLAPSALGTLGRRHTPTRAILLTGLVMVVLILALSVENVAKLGSTFNLLVFGLINLAVIVFRESRIDSYDPGFRVPLYPWTPLAGVVVSGWLIVEMGWITALAAIVVVAAAACWFVCYARGRVDRAGAIHHVFARLGRRRDEDLREEFREIIQEKGLREDDPYDEILERADLIELAPDTSFDAALDRVAAALSGRVALEPDVIADRLRETGRSGTAPIAHGIALLHLRAPEIAHSELALARSLDGLSLSPPTTTAPRDEEAENDAAPDGGADAEDDAAVAETVIGLWALLSPESKARQHLRILAELAQRADDDAFIDAWQRIRNVEKLKETLLRDARFLALFVGEDPAKRPLVGRQLRRLDLPPGDRTAARRSRDLHRRSRRDPGALRPLRRARIGRVAD
ncbi:MAG: amino acid permease [Planctomycetota bacterium]